MVESRIERGGTIQTERRSYISSRALSAAAFAAAARGHWAIENTLHWVLDVTIREDLSRLRIGHGANNTAVVRHFALNLVRQVVDKRSIKRRRNRAAWGPVLARNSRAAEAVLTSTRCPAPGVPFEPA